MFVYQLYNQAALDLQHNNRAHVPDYAAYLDRWEMQSREAERTLPVVKDMAYGGLPRERMDVYPAPRPHAKVLVFIHGGYWQMLDKAMFHFLARRFHAYGITTVLLTYPLALEASMDQIVASCRNAVRWLYHHLYAFNGDPNQMYVAGHSAGGHLAAMLAATNWAAFNAGIPPNVLKGACFVSGLFNLAPIHFSYLNKHIRMDMETAVRNSPVKLEPAGACPLIVAVGAAETKAFHEQSKALYACWKDKASGICFMQLPQLNHFSIVDAIADPGSALHAAICRLMAVESTGPGGPL